ncbi:HET-domain-containing protein [Hypoxylon sp. NC0597]|nr:HET-domain-containing protein [Hypoxylon sp. NC0597]
MLLCPLCNSFKGVGPVLTEDEARRLSSLPTRSFKHKDILWPNFRLSAETCYCCNILLRGVTGCLQQRQHEPDQVVQVNFSFLYAPREGYVTENDKTVTCEFNDGSRVEIGLFTLNDDSCPCPDAWDDVPVTLRTSPETSSEEAFKKACKWLKDCEDEFHGAEVPEGGDPEDYEHFCASSQEALSQATTLPTRVVDVGRHDGKIKLIEGNGRAQRYLCLSHCWGNKQIITTTRSTLAERMQEIHAEDLSRTFEEAIHMTRRFEVDYIWIDSLCIIQDDAEDWERESARMASIYRNAYLTIAATKSSNGDGGLFAQTPDFEVSGTTPEGEDYYLVFRKKIDHDLSVDGGTPHFPLMNRAWVYQERMLSRRVLHFGYYELFWECSTEIYCECGNIGYLGCMETIPLPNPRKMISSALESLERTPSGNWSNRTWVQNMRFYIARMWRSLVMMYTGLCLTVASDYLPALGGVAKTFAEKRKSPYLAGLFKDSLVDDLLWMTFSCKKPRLSKWRAPSWSWASVDTHVTYEDGLLYYVDDIYTEKQVERTELASIEHCVCTLAGLDDFGQVKSGLLRVTSQLLPTTLLLKTDLDGMQRPMYCLCIDPKAAAPRMWPDYDLSQAGPYQVLPGTEVYCLRMIQKVKHKVDVSLVLRACPTGGGEVFERIGVLQLDPHSSRLDQIKPEARDLAVAALDEAEVRTIDII